MAVQLKARAAAQTRLDLFEVTPDLGLLLGRLAIWVVRASADSIEQDPQRRAEQDDVFEALVEPPLVLTVPDTIRS